MSADAEIRNVLQSAIDAVKAANHGVLCAEDLTLYLVAEIVARDRTLAEAGKVIPARIAANLDMDSRRREVALRAEVETLTADKERMDWLQQQQMREAKSHDTHRDGEVILMAWNRDGHCCPIIHKGDFRGAVDAAMKRDPLT